MSDMKVFDHTFVAIDERIEGLEKQIEKLINRVYELERKQNENLSRASGLEYDDRESSVRLSRQDKKR